MANRNPLNILTPSQFDERKRALAQIERERYEREAQRAVPEIMSDAQENGLNRAYLYRDYGGYRDKYSPEAIAVAVELLEEAGWRVRYKHVAWYNRFWHCFFKNDSKTYRTQEWWFSLTPAENQPPAAQ